LEIPQEILDNLGGSDENFDMPQDPNMMGDDPNMMGNENPNMMGDEQDPNMMGNEPSDMDNDPNMMGDDTIGDDANSSPLDKQITDALGGITNDKDKETVLNYINSLANKGQESGGDMNADMDMQGDAMQNMQESFVKEMNLVSEPRQAKRNKKEIAKPRKSPWIF